MSQITNLDRMNNFDDGEFKISAFDFMNYDQIYLATKMSYYQLNGLTISRLTNNLLFRNALLNHEIELLYPNRESLVDSKMDQDSNVLFDKCIENSVDYDFIVKVLWQRIYIEPIAMKFISMRYSNYANNLYFSNNLNASISKTNTGNQLTGDLISFFPFV